MQYIQYDENGKIYKISTHQDFGLNLEITDEESIIIKKYLRDPRLVVKVENQVIKYSENLNYKRNKISKDRKNLLHELEPFINEKYQVKLNLTAEDISDFNEYFDRVFDMLDHYDSFQNKEAWQYVFVDVYTSGKNTGNYQLLKPNFIK